ncbi:MAG TPA: hypothetical protein VNT81_14730 [Vicinamibacterales bacterium]|nr:hypothetical protein [Vicinamibacterales bacterium]
MTIRTVSCWVFAAALIPIPAAAQQAVQVAERLERGSAVTIQGCVRPAAEPGAQVLTQIVTWPILRTTYGKYGPRHFWTKQKSVQFGEYEGDTLQITGTVVEITQSEIETEPGLRRFGGLVEIEVAGRNVLVDPETINLAIDDVPHKSDVSITSIQLEVSDMLRVMKGCLPKHR